MSEQFQTALLCVWWSRAAACRGGGGALWVFGTEWCADSRLFSFIMHTNIDRFYSSDARACKKCIIHTGYLFQPSTWLIPTPQLWFYCRTCWLCSPTVTFSVWGPTGFRPGSFSFLLSLGYIISLPSQQIPPIARWKYPPCAWWDGFQHFYALRVKQFAYWS